MSLPRSTRCCIQFRESWEGDGFPPNEGCSQLDPSAVSWIAMMALNSLGGLVPLKVAFFAWSVAIGKILTMDNLRKQHDIVIDR